MKKAKITVEVECKDSTSIADLISDLEDGLLCDNIKKSTIKYEENGVNRVDEFENPDFEEVKVNKILKMNKEE